VRPVWPAHKKLPSRRALVAVFIGLLVSACDPSLGPSRAVGVTLSVPGGQPEIRVVLCPGERVTRVEFVEERGGVVGDEDDTRLWQIVAPNGSTADSFIAGVVPADFRQTVPFAQPLPTNQSLAAIVQIIRRPSMFVVFHALDLRPDRVWSVDGVVKPEAFEGKARTRCR